MIELEQTKKLIQQTTTQILQQDLRQVAASMELSVTQLVEFLFEFTKPFEKPFLVQALVKLVEELDQAYYNVANPFVTDDEYDHIRNILNSIDPKSKAKVGAPLLKITVWPKVELSIAMGSLLKVTETEEVVNWLRNKEYTKNDGTIFASDKMDGSSLEVSFENGVFVQGASRGEGIIGDDLTPNVARIQFPKQIPIKSKVKIRGECMLHISDFKEHFQEYKNPRNSAAGTVRRLDGKRCEYLKLYGFWVWVDGHEFKTKKEMMDLLKSWGFLTPRYQLLHTDDWLYNRLEASRSTHIWKYLETCESTRGQLDYEIDGIVLEENDISFFEQAGQVNNRPKAARAFKFKSLGGTTTLNSITWQVGRLGSITPVGELNPVDVGGVTISRVMLNNMDQINKFQLSPGCTTTIVRANDVIPMLSGASSQDPNNIFKMPEHCPSCGTKTEFDSVRVLCPNKEECPDQTQYRVYHYLKCLDVKGAGEKVIEKLFEQGELQNLSDIYKLSLEDWSEASSGEKVAAKILQDLTAKSKELPIPVFIKALGFRLFAESFTEIVMEKYPTLEAMRKASVEDVVGIPRIGPAVAEAMVDGFKKNSDLIDELLKYVTLVKPQAASNTGPLVSKTFCFTGCRATPDQETALMAAGGKVVSGVSSKTTHLVVADLSSESGKMKKAKELGLVILDLGQFQRLLAQL